ncbi:MAG: hypothetical protein ACLQFR_02720 [Streptosporangiaceae bacterium]
MKETIPQPARRGRHLAAVPALGAAPKGTDRGPAAGDRPGPASAKRELHPLARLDVEKARQFVMELDVNTAGTDPLRAMFLLGRCVEHAQALLDVLDVVVAL